MLTKTTYCFFLLLLSCSVYAQQQDSAYFQNKVQSLVKKTDSLGKKLSTDTLSLKAKKKLARLQAKKQRTQQKVDKFKNENQPTGASLPHVCEQARDLPTVRQACALV